MYTLKFGLKEVFKFSTEDRAVERAWKAWQIHGARAWKGGPKITKTKEK